MATRHFVVILAVVAAIVWCKPAAAVETLSTAELASHCERYLSEPDGTDAVFCVRYIQGFIDGAVATDEQVARNVAADYERRETLTERARRTRGRGIDQFMDRFGSTYYAEFCLGAPVPLREVVLEVVDHLAAVDLDAVDDAAREVVYALLRDRYPCRAAADQP